VDKRQEEFLRTYSFLTAPEATLDITEDET
jgi:hypothetical protein